MKEQEKQQIKKWNTGTVVIFLAALAAYCVLMYLLCYRQAFHPAKGQWFESDIDAYLLKMQGKDSGFDFPYPIYFAIGRFFMHFTNVGTAASVATTLLNGLSVIVLAYFLQQSLQESYDAVSQKGGVWHKLSAWSGLLTVFLTFSIFFVSMLYAPKGVYLPGMDHKYLGVFSANPLHNQTYMATRPFAIVAFFLFARILTWYDRPGQQMDRSRWYELALFSLFLLLTTMTKPSFTLVFVSAAGLVMLVRLCRNHWKTLRVSLILAAAFIPTFLALLYQFGGVFGKTSHAGAEGGIGFGIGAVWGSYTHNIVLAIMLALAFPGFLLLCNLKELRSNTLYRFSWEMMVAGLLEFLCLYEKGERFIHANFSWGYMHGIFFVFVTSLILLVRNTIGKKQKWYLLLLQWMIFFWHLGCGILYFLYIYSGQFYYSF